MSDATEKEPGLELVVNEDPRIVLYFEQLRDGRIAIGTRREIGERREPGELQLLESRAYLDLAAWLAPLVSRAWSDAIRERQPEPLRTARELYGDGPEAASRLALEMLDQLPPDLLARAMILLANSIGPEARNRLVQRLNQTSNPAEDSALRRQMADENEAFAYAVAAAALYDAIASGRADYEE